MPVFEGALGKWLLMFHVEHPQTESIIWLSIDATHSRKDGGLPMLSACCAARRFKERASMTSGKGRQPAS